MRFDYVKLKYTFLGIFLVLSALMVAYDFFITKPKRACEAAEKWWNDKDRRCYLPIEITTITGRHEDQGATSSSALPAPGTQSTSPRP